MKSVLIVVISIILVIAIGLAVVMGLLIAGKLPQNAFDFSPTLELANRQTFDAASLSQVSISYRSDSVELYVTDGDEVVLEEYFSNWKEEYLARTSINSGHLQISQGERRSGISFGFFSWNSKIKLFVPRQWLGSLSAETSSGSIRCEDSLQLASFSAKASSGSVRIASVQSAGAITLSASSGSVHAENLDAEGDITLSASSGSIRIGTAHGANIYAEGSSGSIQFENAAGAIVRAKASSGSIKFGRLDGAFDLKNSSGSIRVESGTAHGTATGSSGSIRVSLSALDGDVSLQGTSGNVRLAVPNGTAMHFSASTTSGSISSPDDDALSYNQKGNQASGSFGASPQHHVNLQASSGSVRLEWN